MPQKDKKIKALVLSHISELMGGAERSMLDLFDYWAKQYDIEPEFILREPIKSLAGEIKNRGWQYHALRYTFWSEVNSPSKTEDIFRAAVLNATAIKQIEEIIKSAKPDIVITNSIISPWAAVAAHFQKVPHVWIVREYGGLDHGRTFEIGEQPAFEDVGNLSNLVVANSETLAKHIGQYVDKAKVTAVYNPFDLNKIRKLSEAKIASPYKSGDSLKLVITSRVAPTKGQLEAVQAIAILNNEGHNVELAIVGENDNQIYNQQIRKVIEYNNLEKKVHFTGFQPNALAFVSLADVGILTSRKEAFGRTTFEFLALGKPVVGSNSGATPEMVEPGVNGYLFTPEAVQELAQAIKNYVTDSSLIEKHGEASRKKAEQMMKSQYSADALYEKLLDIIEGRGQPKALPMNLTHRWLDYIEVADRFIKQSGQTSLYRIARLRLRQKAKGAYWRLRSVKARLTGK